MALVCAVRPLYNQCWKSAVVTANDARRMPESDGVKAMLAPDHISFEDLSDRLRAYEQRYGYSTIEFFRRFERGELGDDDDLMMWMGLYHLYLTSHPVRQFMQRETAAA